MNVAMAKKQPSKEISPPDAKEEDNKEEVIVQYIAVRNDLGRNQSRSFNTLIAHTASAATAAVHMYGEHEHTEAYLKDVNNMRKSIFQVDNEDELFDLDNRLMMNKVDYKMWIKQPENSATCIATRPYPKSELEKHFKDLKIYKK